MDNVRHKFLDLIYLFVKLLMVKMNLLDVVSHKSRGLHESISVTLNNKLLYFVKP